MKQDFIVKSSNVNFETWIKAEVRPHSV